jgi:MFS family permease
MHRAIAVWLTERPWRAAGVIAFCSVLTQLVPPLTVFVCAIPVLSVLRFGARNGLIVAAIGTVAASWITHSLAPTVMAGTFIGIALTFFGPLALGLLLKRTGSLNLCFQVAVLAIGVLLAVVHAVLPDPVGFWKPLLLQLLDSMQQAGIKIEGDRDVLVDGWAPAMWGALGMLTLATLFGSMLLGRWWDSLVRAPGGFGAEYRNLRLGVALGVVVTVVFVLAIVTNSPLISALAWVAFAALAFQGLAAAHRSLAGGRLNRGWLAAIYLLLIVPLSSMLTMFVLASWGFADNWLRPRRPASL